MSVHEIEAKGLKKSFGSLDVLKGIDVHVDKGEVVSLVGPSGSGKSTFLRCLNLLEMPNGGQIFWDGELVPYETMTPKEVAKHRMRMGMVFQHFNLFGHMRAIENVMEGPVQVLGKSKTEAREEAMQLLGKVGLEDKAEAWPSQLSGGQKQRVAIARALAMNPDVLLLDEVTSALDVEIVSEINELLAQLAQDGMTMVMVTHDLAFAANVGDRLCFFDDGVVVEAGAPKELLANPQTERLQQFLSKVLRH